MESTATASALVYSERSVEGYFEPHAVLKELIESGSVSDYLLYDEGAQIRVACNSLATVVVDSQIIKFSCFDATKSVPAIDPFTQVANFLQSVNIEAWRAYAFITFDVCRFYFSYLKKPKASVMHVMIPATELVFTKNRVDIRSAEGFDKYINTLGARNKASQKAPTATVLPSLDRVKYVDRVSALVNGIRAGRLHKAILSRCVTLQGKMDLLATHLTASKINTAVRSYAGKLGEIGAVGFSPEILMQSSIEGVIVTNPLAGTRPRGSTAAEDARLHAELFTDAKEVKEHALSIWLAQKEIDSVCMRSSTRIFDFMTVKPYRTVQHLSSRVSGILARNKSPWDALKSLFPGITVSGIGKREAIEWIDCLEEEPRGLYAGAIGWIDSEGASDFAIAIRSAYQYGETVHLNAGAGIVAESVPDLEYQESCNKMAMMSSSIIIETPITKSFRQSPVTTVKSVTTV